MNRQDSVPPPRPLLLSLSPSFSFVILVFSSSPLSPFLLRHSHRLPFPFLRLLPFVILDFSFVILVFSSSPFSPSSLSPLRYSRFLFVSLFPPFIALAFSPFIPYLLSFSLRLLLFLSSPSLSPLCYSRFLFVSLSPFLVFSPFILSLFSFTLHLPPPSCAVFLPFFHYHLFFFNLSLFHSSFYSILISPFLSFTVFTFTLLRFRFSYLSPSALSLPLSSSTLLLSPPVSRFSLTFSILDFSTLPSYFLLFLLCLLLFS